MVTVAVSCTDRMTVHRIFLQANPTDRVTFYSDRNLMWEHSVHTVCILHAVEAIVCTHYGLLSKLGPGLLCSKYIVICERGKPKVR